MSTRRSTTHEDMSFDLGIVPEELQDPLAHAEDELRQTITSLFNETVASHDEFLQRDSIARLPGSSKNADELRGNLGELHDARSGLQAAFERWERLAKARVESRKGGQAATEEGNEKKEWEEALNELYHAFERHHGTLQRLFKADSERRATKRERRRKALEDLQVGFARLKYDELEMEPEGLGARLAKLTEELKEWATLG
ncbi:hypothetical protein H2201_007430 [Coniosporium apollinis]|uniref:Uncharacterized protein n=1 Tax=Coniosporium apollinis TaxID=61459 RepID=A0ABQ9NIZ6_9PEZI|nr:hypothetical protein H2201_007430 [Coniosporium apollinis]